MTVFRIFFLILIILSVTGCSFGSFKNDKKIIITTTFPLYSMTKEIVGDKQDKISVISLIPYGTDIHDFTLSPQSAKDITKADVIFINGAGLENAIIKDMAANNKNIIDVSQNIDFIYNDDDSRFPNPHVWIDPVNAKKQVAVVLREIIELDPQNKQYYETNSDKLVAELDKIITLYKSLPTKKHRYISIHNAFLYLKPYNWDQALALDPNDAHAIAPQTILDAESLLNSPDVVILGSMNVHYKVLDDIIAKHKSKYIELDTIEMGKDNENYLDKLKQNYEKLKLFN